MRSSTTRRVAPFKRGIFVFCEKDANCTSKEKSESYIHLSRVFVISLFSFTLIFFWEGKVEIFLKTAGKE